MERDKVIRAVDSCFDYWLDQHRYLHQLELETVRQFKDEALAILKEQEAEIERLKRPDCEHANHDGAGCLGYCGCEQDDEPIEACKQCEKYTGNICAEY